MRRHGCDQRPKNTTVSRLASDKMAGSQQRLDLQRAAVMHKLLLAVTAAAIISAPAFTPAHAMTVGTASGIRVALADTSMRDEVVYVCRHRYVSSRRVCSWKSRSSRWRWPWRRR